MGEDEGGAGDIADLGGAGGEVLQGPPAAGEQGEPAFSAAAQRALEGVTGAGIDIGLPPVCGSPDRDVDADAGACSCPGRSSAKGRPISLRSPL